MYNNLVNKKINQNSKCCLGNSLYSGYVSSNFIRNRGQETGPTLDYNGDMPAYLTNNVPATQIYVRLGKSQYDSSKYAFWINGWENPRLNLIRNNKYQFNIKTPGFPFVLVDSNGNNLTVVPPTDYDTFTIQIDNNFPDTFNYISVNNVENQPIKGVVKILKKAVSSKKC